MNRRGDSPDQYGQEHYEHRHYGPGDKRSDEQLKEDISERLLQAYDIDSSEVTIQVSGGRVLLEGTVPDGYMKHAIEDLADAAPGVQDVENRLRVVA
jgi:osmotically-inducible protein OsmY